MLTGQTIVSSGQILTQGFNQLNHLQKIYRIIGYCPQFDALLEGLTCRDTMILFSKLRGIPAKNVKNFIENTARGLDFIQHIDKEVKQLRLVQSCKLFPDQIPMIYHCLINNPINNK